MTNALELYVINADGTGLTQITHDGTFHGVPRWSPDGSTSHELPVAVVATIRADGTDEKLLSSPVWDSLEAEYTVDGRHIVFSSQTDGLVAAL